MALKCKAPLFCWSLVIVIPKYRTSFVIGILTRVDLEHSLMAMSSLLLIFRDKPKAIENSWIAPIARGICYSSFRNSVVSSATWVTISSRLMNEIPFTALDLIWSACSDRCRWDPEEQKTPFEQEEQKKSLWLEERMKDQAKLKNRTPLRGLHREQNDTRRPQGKTVLLCNVVWEDPNKGRRKQG